MADALPVPSEFERSYKNFEEYPQNLVHQTSYPAAIEACAARLDNAAPLLFTNNDENIDVPFRDVEAIRQCAISFLLKQSIC